MPTSAKPLLGGLLAMTARGRPGGEIPPSETGRRVGRDDGCRTVTPPSVLEVAFSCEDHRQSEFVRGLDHFFVLH